nr:AP-1 complex-associated regulatory protein-like isoform X1 [Dermacentor andersoni]
MIIYYFKGMGSCFSYCCKEQNKRVRHVKPAGYFDTSSLIEFETLIDEQPSSEPKSLQSLELPVAKFHAPDDSCCNCSSELQLYHLNFEELSASDDDLLSLSGLSDNDESIIIKKLAFHQEDALELEEEAKAQPDTVEAPPISVGQRVVMRSNLAKEDNWTGADHNAWALAGEEEILNTAKLRCQGHLPNCPQFQTKAWDKERERLNSSPHSSLDLEWENEVGLTPPQRCASATDDDFVYVPGVDTCSNHSTPLSNENDLEWDGDLSSVQIGGFDMETEQLISEIEQMTVDALKEPSGASR